MPRGAPRVEGTERALLARVKAHRVTVKGNSEWHALHPRSRPPSPPPPTEARVSIHIGPHRHSNAAPERPRAEVQAERGAPAAERSASASSRVTGIQLGTRRTGCELCARENAPVRRLSVAPVPRHHGRDQRPLRAGPPRSREARR